MKSLEYGKIIDCTRILETVGKRVFNVWRDIGSPHGTVIEIEQGCNGGARVRWDGRDYDVSMNLNDLALVDSPELRLSEIKDPS